LGAKYKSQSGWHRVGSCEHSDACVFSFHPVKGITTGEGGAVTTNRRDIYEAVSKLRTHGIVKQPQLFLNKRLAFPTENGTRQAAPWYYEMQDLGFNYRITDFQCMLGISQLSRLSAFINKRREIAHYYDRQLGDFDLLEIPREDSCIRSAYHLYVVRLKLDDLSTGRAGVFNELRAIGLGVQVHYIPVHLQPFYKKLGYKLGDFPNAEEYYERALSIPIYPGLKLSQREMVVATLKRVLSSYARRPMATKKGVVRHA